MTSTYKTISLLIALCILLVTVLFVYRAQQSYNTQVYTSENATMFSVGRVIKPFELLTATGEKFNQHNFIGHWTLLFFGFTHCATVCPTTLDMLAHAYDKLTAIKPAVQVVLVSLDPTRDTTEALKVYTQQFNQQFIGVTGQLNQIRQLQAQLNVFSENDREANNGSNYQIQHTSSILLINPKGEWAGLFSYGMKPEQFAYEFEMATHAAA